MDRDQYFVVLHKGEWKIKHNGRHSHPYETQADAISSAVEAAHAAHTEGGLSQVLVQGQDLLFRTEWTYGKDPYPPQGQGRMTMPGNAEECRTQAAKCRQLASGAPDDKWREHFTDLALSWDRLAADLEASLAFIRTMEAVQRTWEQRAAGEAA
jgi:Uncharacterized protein conserved in bacteria (DUF2188)